MKGSLLCSLLRTRASCLLAGCLLTSCADQAPAQPPPPLPALSTRVPVPAEAEPAEAESVEAYAPPIRPGAQKARTPSSPRESQPPQTKPRASTAQAKANSPKAEAPPESARPVAVPPLPVAPPAPAPAASPATVASPLASTKKVIVPRTANVHVDYPLGLQSDLDADPRMQVWVDKVIAIVDGCHAKNRSAQGAISTRITMHENERPDADILALPGPLSGVVACATGSLMRVKMPLFTGREGTRYDVRIVFE